MPKIVDHDKYREKLINGCFELFAEKGYSNVTMRQIAMELGISTGALYHYFPTKQSILEQMFELMSRKDVEEAIAATSVSGSFEKRIKLFFDFFMTKESVFSKMLLLSIDFIRNHNSDNARRTARQWMDYYIRNMSVYLEIPTQLAMLITAFLNGIIYQNNIVPEIASLREQIDFFKKILMVYIGEHKDPKNRLCNICPFMTDYKIIEEVPH